ncbi:MAG TPA: hypothetical protein VK519_13440 [Pinirhizobacter sp.]|uniref:hypothetical protein n=1 Tax=Pinirhizobacter sp. TaxID=2950432 RepID=UPI002C9E19AD|nr:hypothetical protein [Pinirhizobacter sp.]HMH68911.1 hypothetical protein [Pinirhizobacter sp.]
MASIFTNLAFMHGHITDVALARRLAGLPEDNAQPTKPSRPAKREKVAEIAGVRPSTAPSHWMILGLR